MYFFIDIGKLIIFGDNWWVSEKVRIKKVEEQITKLEKNSIRSQTKKIIKKIRRMLLISILFTEKTELPNTSLIF
jgi:hypothetical protein